MAEDVYNQWRDSQHVHGILRKTVLADYLKPEPDWHTVIDYDVLAAQDKTSWVAKDLKCLYPSDRLCLVSLSAGGEDADTLREFDLKTGQFVANGFVLPHSKQEVTWVDANTLYVARDWGPGTMTKSGYPFVVKEWKRGTPLDSAKEIYRGQESDIAANASTLYDAQGDRMTVFARALDFFSTEVEVLTADRAKASRGPWKEPDLRLAFGASLDDHQRRLDAFGAGKDIQAGFAAFDESEGIACRSCATEAYRCL